MPVLLVGLDTGGYYPRTWYVGTLAFAGVMLVTIAARMERVSRPGLAFVVLLLLLAGWTLASAAWAIAGTAVPDEAMRTLFYASAAGALVLVADRNSVPALLAGVFASIIVLCSYGVADRLFGSNARSPFQGTLLYEPIGYANALGIAAAMGLLLGFGLAGYASTVAARALVASGTAVAAAALVLTESRGSFIALASGSLILVARAASLRGRLRLFALGVPLFVALVVTLLVEVSLGDRPSYWRIALEDWAAHPLLGSGAGSFAEYWRLHGQAGTPILDAHSLYLESAGELGVVGLGLVVSVLVVSIVSGARRIALPLVPAALATFVAFVVHAALDWDWEVPATVLPAIACAAALLAEDSQSPSPT